MMKRDAALATVVLAGLLCSCQTPGATTEEAAAAAARHRSLITEKPGFSVREDDGRIWVLKPGQEESETHTTLIGAGPDGCTIKALDKQTALEYLAAKPGFIVEVEGTRIWVLRPGQEKAEQHITMVGAGPRGMTVVARNRETALVYLATMPGFEVELHDEHFWVFEAGTAHQRPRPHATKVGVGPSRMTVKAVDNKTLDAYLATWAEMGV